MSDVTWRQKGSPLNRPALFCPKCDRCMSSKEDVRSRDERGFCARCSELTASDAQQDVVTIVLSEGA